LKSARSRLNTRKVRLRGYSRLSRAAWCCFSAHTRQSKAVVKTSTSRLVGRVERVCQSQWKLQPPSCEKQKFHGPIQSELLDSELFLMLELEGQCEFHGCPSGVNTPLTNAVIEYFKTVKQRKSDAISFSIFSNRLYCAILCFLYSSFPAVKPLRRFKIKVFPFSNVPI